MPPISRPSQISSHIEPATTRGIASSIGRMVTSGELPPGTQLPTVRELAADLGVSPSTVSLAWKSLIKAGVIATHRRGGTVVLAAPPSAPTRYVQIQPSDPTRLDLSEGVADASLLPDLAPALRRCSSRLPPSTYFDSPILAELEAVLRPQWPFEPEQLTIVDGALDALERLFAVTVHVGARVVVENPTFPPILDLLEARGAEILPVQTDEQGLIAGQLAKVVAGGQVTAVVIQPRAHNPSGHSMSAKRAAELAEVLRGSEAVVFEDDHANLIASSEPVSLGTHLPARTVLIRGYSKSISPDLRLAAVGGTGAIIQQLIERRMLGPSWSSRLLQEILLDLISNRSTAATLRRARREYGRRRAALVDALAQRNVVTHGSDGINVWVDVADERRAIELLLTKGIAVAPGSLFMAEPLGQEHVRITISRLPSNIETIAQHVAEAAHAAPRRRIVV